MSHLTTIIRRVKRRLEVYEGKPEEAAKDFLWTQSIRNLREYQKVWTDQTEEEVKEANILYSRYRQFLKPCK